MEVIESHNNSCDYVNHKKKRVKRNNQFASKSFSMSFDKKKENDPIQPILYHFFSS